MRLFCTGYLDAARTMVHIERVDLSRLGVRLPSDRVGMVIAQPYVPDTSLSAAEPYQCTEQAKQQQFAVLTETLAVARAARHGVDKTHFTIFPEYSIPGLEGISLVQDASSRTTGPGARWSSAAPTH